MLRSGKTLEVEARRRNRRASEAQEWPAAGPNGSKGMGS